MFKVIEKETQTEIIVYGIEYIQPEKFYHNGYIAFLIFEDGSFVFSDSKNYKPVDNISDSDTL